MTSEEEAGSWKLLCMSGLHESVVLLQKGRNGSIRSDAQEIKDAQNWVDTSWAAKHDLDAFIFSPAVSSFSNTVSNCLRCSSNDSFVIIKRSLMYARTQSNPAKSSFIFSWKMSGLLHRPIGNFKYSYLPQGSTIVHSLLDSGSNFI